MKQKILFLFTLILLFSVYEMCAQTVSPGLFPNQTLPDNIRDVSCNITPSSTIWSIQELAKSPNTEFVNAGSCVLTGDIDGDGEIELIVQNNIDATTDTRITAIYIYGFNKATQSLYRKYTINIPVLNINQSYAFGNITVANVNGNQYASIFYTCADGYLYKYDYNSGNYTQSWRSLFSSNPQYVRGVPIVADFNNLGRVQVNVYDKIFDAVSGTLLVDGGYLGNSTYSFGLVGHVLYGAPLYTVRTYMSSMHAGDINGDGTLEIVGGDCVYKVTIADPDNYSASNKFELIQRANSSGRTDIADGGTALVDMDLDGQLDVVVIAKAQLNETKSVYVYNPRTGAILHTNQINDIPKYPTAVPHGPSMPFVGDLDGDGYPEIALTSRFILQTYKLNVATNQIELFWQLATQDGSASTTLTLFDFNQTGISQLVYRDQSTLRIIDGRASISDASRTLASFNVISYTINEYPTVADINGDGQAEIMVTGGNGGVIGGWLYVFGSGDPIDHPWAPARSVWNTNAYNAVNVNEDLTIPKYHLNPATVFPGYNGVLGGGDDVRPFNNFLQQQTILNQDGTPLWPGPEAQVSGTPTFNYNESDAMTVTIDVKNAGDAIFQSPFYITAYRDNVGGSPSYTHTHIGTIGVGQTETISFTIPSFSSWIEYNFIVIKLNDKGDGRLNDQEVCRDSQSQYRYYGLLPTEQDVCAGKVGELACSFTLNGGTNHYQWQSSKNGQIWENITDAPDASKYTPANQRQGIIYYRVVVSDGVETINSESVKIRVRSCQLPVNHNISVMGYYD